jgi:anti-anti-sigma factor
MAKSSLQMAEVRAGQNCVLALTGRIDSTNADELTARVNRLFAAGEKYLVVDFKEVLYLTSAAFRVLFEMGGLLDAFTIHASREEALAQTG